MADFKRFNINNFARVDRIKLNDFMNASGKEINNLNLRIADQLSKVPQPSEVIDARNGEPSLSIRLERDKDETAGDIAEVNQTLDLFNSTKADISYVEFLLSTIVSGAPKGVFATLAALENAYPNGADGVFLVLENNQNESHVYYWDENTKSWRDAGPYQGTGLEAVLTVENAPWRVE